MSCLSLRPELEPFRVKVEREGVEISAYINDIVLGLMGVTASTVRAIPLFRRGLDGIGIVTNPANPWRLALPPEGNIATVEEGGLTMVGVPTGTQKCVAERAVGEVRGEGAGCLVRCLPGMPVKQAAALITAKSLGNEAATSSTSWTRVRPSKQAGGPTMRRSGFTSTSSNPTESRQGTIVLRGGV